MRRDWAAGVPGMVISETPVSGHVDRQYIITYDPGDTTHYLMSVVPAHWARMTGRVCDVWHSYWQLGVWSGSGNGNGTMVVRAGDGRSVVQSDDSIQRRLRCSAYSTQVFSIMLHGCLGSHNPKRASEIMAGLREAGRMGFVDAQLQDGGAPC